MHKNWGFGALFRHCTATRERPFTTAEILHVVTFCIEYLNKNTKALWADLAPQYGLSV